MPSLHTLLALALPPTAVLFALVQPRLSLLGVRRAPHPALNVGECSPLEGLEACEDVYVDRDGGVAYLACSSLALRATWSPSQLALTSPVGPSHSSSTPPDSLRVFDYTSGTHKAVELTGMPEEAAGRVWVHGMDGVSLPSSSSSSVSEEGERELLLALISHRPPSPSLSDPSVAAARAQEEGAASVVELFRTSSGSSTAAHVQTVAHPLVRTPNNLALDYSEKEGRVKGFWVSNDHAEKVGWRRKLELVWQPTSEIVFCALREEEGVEGEQCWVAAEGIRYPNGLAKGPEDLLYGASTFSGEITVYEIQHDKTLLPVDTIPLSRPIDNLHLSPLTSALYAATFPKMLDFASAMPVPEDVDRPREGRRRSAVEVWRVGEETGEGRFYGHKYRTDVVLADPSGDIVSAVTSAAPYKDTLLLTGYFTPHAVLCRLPEAL